MMTHDEMLDNVAVYALGALPPSEATEVAAHLSTCAQCRAEYDFLRPAVTAFASAAVDESAGAGPSPLLKKRIMRRVRNSSPSARGGFAWPVFSAVAACVAFALGALLVDASLSRRIGHDTATMTAQTQTLNAQTQTMKAQSQVIGDLAAADAKRFPFGHGSVVVRGSRLYVAMPRLATPPPGKVYQAWTLPKGSKKMAPSITFMPAQRNDTVIQLPESADAVTAVAVSVEPDGGSKQPTSTPIAVTEL